MRCSGSGRIEPGGYDVLLFLDSIEEVMHLSEQSQSDPDFAARIEVIQVRGKNSQIFRIAGSCMDCGAG